MEVNAQKECATAGTYNFQGNSIKIVVRLAKNLEIAEDKSQIDKLEKGVNQKATLKKLIIFITTEDALSSGEVSNNQNVPTSFEILEENNINSVPCEVIHSPLDNHLTNTKNKCEIVSENEHPKTSHVEDLGTKEKKFKGLWSWVRSAMTPEMQRKNRKGEIISVTVEPEMRIEMEGVTNSGQEFDDDIPEIGTVAIDNDIKEDSFEDKITYTIENATIFDVTKVQEPLYPVDSCTTDVPNVAKCLLKINNYGPEVQDNSFTDPSLVVI